MIAHDESQALDLLHVSGLPLRETRIDRYARPLEQWNVRPTPAEWTELKEAQRDRRREVEAAIAQELRQERTRRLMAAGL